MSQNIKPREFKEAYVLSMLKHFQQILDNPIQRGGLMRKALQIQTNLGRPTNHFRFDFLRKSGNKVSDTINQIIKDFSKEHPEDQISLADVFDILDVVRIKYQLASTKT